MLPTACGEHKGFPHEQVTHPSFPRYPPLVILQTVRRLPLKVPRVVDKVGGHVLQATML